MKHIERRGTYSVKVDGLQKYYGNGELVPLWVADMDFETPDCVREALQEVVDGGVYGYNLIPDNYFPTIAQWLATRQKWEVEQEWLAFIPGIVKGIGYAINHFTQKGDGVIVQPPVYPPFLNVPKGNGRELVFNPLIRVEDGDRCAYRMDFDNLREICAKGNCKLLILSNPHNPGGIAWDADTLREPFYKWMQVNELSSPTIFATLGAIAAYTKGDEWRMKMLDYIEGNVVFVEEFCKNELGGLIKPIRPLSSFLIWLDCRELCNRLFGCADQQRLVHLFIRKAGLALNDGAAFGPGGEGYMRLNVGCGLEVLQDAMKSLKTAIDEY